MKKTKYPGIYKTYKEKLGRTCFMLKIRFEGKLLPTKNLTTIFQVNKIEEALKVKKEIVDKLRRGIDPFNKDQLYIKNDFEIKSNKENKEITINEYWEYELEKYKKTNSYNTYKLYKSFYNLYIKTTIGNYYISEIKTIDIENLRFSILKDKSENYASLLKRLLSPIFEKAKYDGFVKENIFNAIKFNIDYTPKEENKISSRTSLKHKDIAKTLYNYIPNYNSQFKKQREELKVFLYFYLLSGKRYGEIFGMEIQHLDIDKNIVNFSRDNNKTNVSSMVPIPKECLDFFKKRLNKNKEEKVFKNIKYSAFYGIFQRFKKGALGNDDFKLTAHDSRSLLMVSMYKLGVDTRLIDFILDHKEIKREVKEYYLEYSYEDKEEAYDKYWSFLRS